MRYSLLAALTCVALMMAAPPAHAVDRRAAVRTMMAAQGQALKGNVRAVSRAQQYGGGQRQRMIQQYQQQRQQQSSGVRFM